MSGDTREAAQRLDAWNRTIHRGRFYAPQYQNVAALKADLRALLLERQALREQVRQLEQDRDDERMEYQSKFYRMRDGLEAQVVALREQVDAAETRRLQEFVTADEEIESLREFLVAAESRAVRAEEALRDIGEFMELAETLASDLRKDVRAQDAAAVIEAIVDALRVALRDVEQPQGRKRERRAVLRRRVRDALPRRLHGAFVPRRA